MAKKTEMVILVESATMENSYLFLGRWNGSYEKARFVSEYPDAAILTDRREANRIAEEINAKFSAPKHVYVISNYGLETETRMEIA